MSSSWEAQKNSMKRFIRSGVTCPHVWPVGILAFVIAPAMAFYTIGHQLSGPDVRLRPKNFETYQTFDNKKFKHISTYDYSTPHPRPRF